MTIEEELQNTPESNVIGGLLLNFGECREALEVLDPDDFRNTSCKAIFTVMKEMERDGGTIDVPLVMRRIEQLDNSLKEPAMYCAQTFVSFATYSEYISKVKEDGQQRRFRERVFQAITTEGNNSLAEVSRIVEDEEARNKSTDYKDHMARVCCDFIEAISNPGKEKRINTGYQRLDNALCGLRLKTMSIIGARPSTGKTTFALNIIRNQLNKKFKTVLFSLEMSDVQIFERMSADICGINYGVIGRRELTQEQINRISQTVAAIQERKNFYIFSEVYTVEKMAMVISQIKPDFVVVDFIQCVRTAQHFRDRRAEIDYISQEFKRLAKRYNCHIMVLSQITRAGKSAPRMSDLKESGGLEQDGDYVMLLHRPYVLDKSEDSDPGETVLLLDKNKYGNTGTSEMHFTGHLQRFTEIIEAEGRAAHEQVENIRAGEAETFTAAGTGREVELFKIN